MKFKIGDIVKIRQEKVPGRIIASMRNRDGSWRYEVKAIGLRCVPTREVKESDLSLA